MAIFGADGNEIPLQVGDILFYDTSNRWPDGFGPFSKADARTRQRGLDNFLIRKLQGSPITHAAVVTRFVEDTPYIVDIVADRDVNEHEVREGDFRLEGVILRPQGQYRDEVIEKLVAISKAHVGDNNVGLHFSRAKTWGTRFALAMATTEKPHKEVEKDYAQFILEDLYANRYTQKWGHTEATFKTYCAEYIAILIALSCKELLEDKNIIEDYDEWLTKYAKTIYRTTTSGLQARLKAFTDDAPITFKSLAWQNEFSANARKPVAVPLTPLFGP